MTRIAVFCDGTWNSPDIPEPTNVHKMYKAVRHMPGNGQVTAYFPGLGVDEDFDGKVRRFLNKYGGGAFGWGLDSKVKRAYQFIARVYQPGDEIYLFGFSRGAYTARSVAGMIRKCGIVADTSEEGINAAWKLYRKKGRRNSPDKLHILKERRALSPKFATSDKDVKWRGDSSDLVKISFVGVWDTVGARGLPLALLGPIAAIWNRQYAFHDMSLSSSVRSARHAVALDEKRVLYKPALWSNLGGSDGLNEGRTDALRPYQQIWFVGNHALVGGSGDCQDISAYPLMWVLEGAGRLVRDPSVIFPPARGNILADSQDVVPKTGWLSKWRAGPTRKHQVHPTVRERVNGRPDYSPESLSKIKEL